MVFDAFGDFAGGAVGDISVGGREMGENFAAVDALPVKGVVGDFVDRIPAHFLGEERFDVEFAEYLGEGGGVAEYIGEPHVDGAGAEVLTEVVATV